MRCGRSSFPSMPVSVVAGEGGGSTLLELTRTRKSAGRVSRYGRDSRSCAAKRNSDACQEVRVCECNSATVKNQQKRGVNPRENQLGQRQLCHQMFSAPLQTRGVQDFSFRKTMQIHRQQQQRAALKLSKAPDRTTSNANQEDRLQ